MTEYYEQLTQEEQEKLQEMIQMLFRQTFLLERKYDRKEERFLANKDYYFCEKHMEFLSWYLGVAGIRIYENSDLGTIYIQGEPTLGGKLSMLATIYLLLFKLLYDEQMAAASTSTHIVTTLGELNSKAGEFCLMKSLSSITEMRRALSILKRYQMIEILDSMDELNENTRIIIFPCIHIVMMREDIQKLLKTFSEENNNKEEEESEQEELELTSSEEEQNWNMEETKGERQNGEF